jgi:hypothetical protein
MELESWCRDELARQNSLVIPDIGFDLLAKTTRSVRLSVFEALEGSSAANLWDENSAS